MYYQNEPRINGVYSRDDLPNKIKDEAYVINLDGYSDIGTHWVALYANNKTVTNFDSFGVAHIPKEIKKFINNKNIIAKFFRLQAYDSVMCGYFCLGFIDFMLNGGSLTDFTNLFSSNNFKRNDDSIGTIIATVIAITGTSFATVIGTPAGIKSASFSLTFSFCRGLVQNLLQTTRNKKTKHNKIVVLTRSKLNSIENKISETLMNNQISHEDFMAIINEERNYWELKESIRMMKSQEDKKIDID